ncbi:ribosome biogenesis GTP-binding protein YihA/YsxC [Olsenella phocaeensis]|uniref:ribosome biogenesis GTP-binding protein YihA/YsxC n=1 Tax=Olsenella phocaeensis TaxID=1852385 RepID=UPI0028DB0600|nr:ribosome biogenesis GTP-binding protein YihA/YsxC [uncultured Olsenella sp.]
MAVRYNDARFVASYGRAEQIPEPSMPEVSFAGRSNVGKSSLLNKLLGRKALAKVSSQPGRTANVNFFEADGIDFVDLPGYGFAKVSKAERARWAALISGYFEQERSFNLVVVLVDIRHDAQDLDRQMISFLQEGGYPFVVALTKADKIGRSKQGQQRAALARAFGVDVDRFVVTSAQTGQGIDELQRRIELAVDEPEGEGELAVDDGGGTS